MRRDLVSGRVSFVQACYAGPGLCMSVYASGGLSHTYPARNNDSTMSFTVGRDSPVTRAISGRDAIPHWRTALSTAAVLICRSKLGGAPNCGRLDSVQRGYRLRKFLVHHDQNTANGGDSLSADEGEGLYESVACGVTGNGNGN